MSKRTFKRGGTGYVLPEPGKSHAGGSGSSPKFAEREAKRKESMGKVKEAQKIRARIKKLKPGTTEGKLTLTIKGDIQRISPQRISKTTIQRIKPRKTSRQQPSLLTRAKAGFVASLFDPVGATRVLTEKATKKFQKIPIIGKMSKKIGRAGSIVRVEELEKAKRKGELIGRQNLRLEEENKEFQIKAREIKAGLEKARTEKEVTHIISEFPELSFKRKGDQIIITNPKIRARQRSLASLAFEQKRDIERSKVKDFSLENIKRSSIGVVASLPKMPFIAAGAVESIKMGGAVAGLKIAKDIVKSAKERPVTFVTQTVVGTVLFSAGSKFLRPKVTLKTTPVGKTKMLTYSVLKGTKLSVKQVSQAKIKSQVFVGGKPFFKPSIDIVKSVSELSGKPKFLGTKGETTFLRTSLKGTLKQPGLPTQRVSTVLFSSVKPVSKRGAFQSQVLGKKSLMFFKESIEPTKFINEGISRTVIKGQVPAGIKTRFFVADKSGKIAFVKKVVILKPRREVLFGRGVNFAVKEPFEITQKGFKTSSFLIKGFTQRVKGLEGHKFGIVKGRSVIIEPKIDINTGGGKPMVLPTETVGGLGISPFQEVARKQVLFIDMQETFIFPGSRSLFETKRAKKVKMAAGLSLKVSGIQIGLSLNRASGLGISKSILDNKSIQKNIGLSLTGVSTRSAQAQGIKTAPQQVLKISSATAGLGSGVGVSAVGSPPPPTIPLFGLTSGKKKKKSKKKKSRKSDFETSFNPSIEAGLFDIHGRRPKRITGLELRPLPF